MNNVSVIIPVYNESFLITKVCLKLLQNLENSKIVNNFEIILVENGSTDNSAILVDKLSQENLKIISLHLPNPDYGKAIKIGINEAQYELLINFSADFVDIEFLHKSLLIINDYDIVIGSYNIDFSDQRSFVRRFGSNVFNSISSAILGVDVSGSHGFKLIKSDIAKKISKQCYMTKDIFDDEMIYRMIKKNYKIKKEPLIFTEIRKPRSGIITRGFRAFRLLIYLKLLIIYENIFKREFIES